MREKSGIFMNKGRIIFVTVLTVAMVVVLALFVGHTIFSVNDMITQSCFDELANTTKQLADELYNSVSSDHSTLSAISTIIGNQGKLDDSELCRIINAYGFDTSYISYLEILRPNGTMLDADGTVRDVSDSFDFDEEVQKGECLSGITQSTRNHDAKVIRHASPIKRDGKTVCMLYGVVLLDDLAEKYTTDLYNGHAYVYIEDGDTGDFMLDTWHKTTDNIADLGNRKTLPGHKSIDEMIKDMQNGIGGEVGFISRSTGNVLYMHYEPLGINNWNVAITVEESYALQQSKSISTSLYLMAGVIGAALLFYITCVIVCLLGAYSQVKKLGTEDQSTGLQNRNMYAKLLLDRQNNIFASISCVYADVNGLHTLNNEQGHAAGDKLLQSVAHALKKEFDYTSIYRIGGDEFIVLSRADDENTCREKMQRIVNILSMNGYSISYGIVNKQNETGLERIVHEADELMLKNKSDYYAKSNRMRV